MGQRRDVRQNRKTLNPYISYNIKRKHDEYDILLKDLAQHTQSGIVALGVGSVGEACLNTQAGDTVKFI